jgi:hypothetical protein
LDESLKEITANILRQLNESSVVTIGSILPASSSTAALHQNTPNVPIAVTTATAGSANATAGGTVSTSSGETNDIKQNQLVLSINTTFVFSYIKTALKWNIEFAKIRRIPPPKFWGKLDEFPRIRLNSAI